MTFVQVKHFQTSLCLHPAGGSLKCFSVARRLSAGDNKLFMQQGAILFPSIITTVVICAQLLTSPFQTGLVIVTFKH